MDEVVDAVARIEGTAAVYARRLDTADKIAVGPVDEPFPTGSAAKYLVLVAYADRVARGRLDPATRVALDGAYRDQRKGSGVLRYLSAGVAPTLHDCASLMMIVSDNVATDLLLDTLGGAAAVNADTAALGVTGADVTSDTVWVMPPGQFGMASPRGLAEAWALLTTEGPISDVSRVVYDRWGRLDPFDRRLPTEAGPEEGNAP